MAVRRFCSQAGDGPFCTPRMTRPAKTGHISGASSRTEIGDGKPPRTTAMSKCFSLPTLAAARSRAMPATPSQSGRFGVTSKSMTGSAPNRPATGVPTGISGGSS